AGAGVPPARRALARDDAVHMVREGEIPVAVVLPRGWKPGVPGRDSGPRAEVLADPSDPLARGVVIGFLQEAAGRRLMRAFGVDSADDQLALPAPTVVQDVAGPQRRDAQRMISFYAAGIAVMFLLFSCSAGGGALLDEQETGTLERVLNTNVGMT